MQVGGVSHGWGAHLFFSKTLPSRYLMLTRRGLTEVIAWDTSCHECGIHIRKGEKFLLLQVTNESSAMEPYCIGCVAKAILEAEELILVLPKT